MSNRLLRKNQVMSLTGLRSTMLWKLEQRGEFPKRVRITNRASAWPANEVESWVAQRIASRGSQAVAA